MRHTEVALGIRLHTPSDSQSLVVKRWLLADAGGQLRIHLRAAYVQIPTVGVGGREFVA